MSSLSNTNSARANITGMHQGSNNSLNNESNPYPTSPPPKQQFAYTKFTNISNELINSSPDNSFINTSPSHTRKHEDTSPRRDSNRKWVRQMTRRIRDFMTKDTTGETLGSNQNYLNDDLITNKNFGIPLEKCEQSSVSPFVPVVIEICTRLIELHITDEGIYRKVGQKQVVTSLRSQLNSGVLNIDVTDFNWDNPHAVVSLLKCFLNELPDSLTTSYSYNDFVQACRIEKHEIRMIRVKKLLHQLPKCNYETLKYLTAHLRRVASAHQSNKMTIKNLCIAFSQSIVRHNDANCETIKTDHMLQSLLIELTLIYHDWLFDPSQIENIPSEVKDFAEHNLYCPCIDSTTYSDLLLKVIRAKWNSTDFSNSKKCMENNQINIQFRSNLKNGMLKSSKSVNSMCQRQHQTSGQENKKISKTPPKKPTSTSQAKHRSYSVDTRFKSFGQLLNLAPNPNNSALNQTVNSFGLETGYKKPSSNYPNRKISILNPSILNVQKPDKHRIFDVKQLEKKNELEREKLHNIMKKLEIDLMNAKIDLIQEDFMNSGPSFKFKPSKSLQFNLSTPGVISYSRSPQINQTKVLTSSSSDELSELIQGAGLIQKLKKKQRVVPVRRHTISGQKTSCNLGEESSERLLGRNVLIHQNCEKFCNCKRVKSRSKIAIKNTRKDSGQVLSKSISYLPSLSSNKSVFSTQKMKYGDDRLLYEKYLDKEENELKRAVLNLSPLSISVSSSSTSTSTNSNSSLIPLSNSNLSSISKSGVKSNSKKNRSRIFVKNIADEVGSIGSAVNQLSSNNSNMDNRIKFNSTLESLI